MKFIDLVNIKVIAGNGGDGFVRFKKNRKSQITFDQFRGSNGGDGGDVWLLADNNINTLNHFHLHHVFRAKNGQNGRSRGCTGKRGEDLFIKVPWGTRVCYKTTNKILGDLGNNQRCLMVAKGGRHGVGNKRYISFIRRDDICNYKVRGEVGECRHLILDLLIIADVGVFGLPNSGKSSFVKIVSNAKTKVSDYPFTTLIPHLGVVYIDNDNKFIIADIPGIITGASQGVGLGIFFLKHLERCRLLLHFVDIFPMDGSDPIKNIMSIEHEVCNYSKKLIDKPRWLVFNKIDLLETDTIKKRLEHILTKLKWKGQYYFISSKYNLNILLLCRDIMKFIVHHV